MKKVLLFLSITLFCNSNLLAQRYFSYLGPDVLKNTFLINDRSFLINANQLDQKEVDSLLGVQPTKTKELHITVAPFTVLNKYNSRLPIGINQGSANPNVGWQQLFSFGVDIQWKNNLRLHVAPEHQFAENLPYPRFPLNSTDWEQHYYYLNHIDIPERFGELSKSLRDINVI